jgi:hypothetical protein
MSRGAMWLGLALELVQAVLSVLHQEERADHSHDQPLRITNNESENNLLGNRGTAWRMNKNLTMPTINSSTMKQSLIYIYTLSSEIIALF